MKITEDTKVAVEFTTEFNVIASSGDGGTIKLNGNNVDKVVIEKGESVNISVTPDNGYQIASVLIDGNTETISDVSAFSKEITVSNNITVIATFTKLYTIKVTYDDKKGTVVTDPACIGGKVVVTEGQGILVTATPNMNYRVSKVVKNGELQEYAENNKTYEDNITKVNKDYTYEITFALNTYKVTSSKTTNGTVSIENSSVDYGQETKITLIPENDLYRIGKITIKTDSNPTGIELDKKAEDIYDEHDDGSSVVTLKNITENTEIEVVFEKVPVVEGDWKEKVFIEPSKGELVNSYTDKDGNEVYAYSKGSVVSIKALPSYDRVNIKFAEKSSYEGWRKEKEISSTYTIEGLKVKTRRWGNEETIKLNKKIIIVIDKTEPKVTLTTEEANSNGYYNKDIKVGIAAIDPDYYSGIKTVEYWVKSDGVETQHDLINVNQEATYNGNIIVDASKNNSDNVEVIVTVTDSSGNIKTEVKKLKINTTKPTISVSIDGTLHPEAKAGYYNVVRKATITIVDRKTSFDETAVLNGLSITAKGEKGNDIAISKSEMLSDWTHSGDTHTATITFKEDANYDWKLSYKNKADLTNDSITQAGNSIYKFTVDKGSPVGSIELEKNSWNSLVSVLTFGIWRNKSVSVEAKGEDSISPLYDIQYYKSNKETALSKEELSKLYDEGKFVIENYTVNPDEQFAVYARIADYAGNILYISTDGIIVDNTASNITLNPDTPNKSGLYNKDVNVDIEVNDSVTQDKAYSGIKTIDYFVENNGVVTQSGNLYKFDEINPTKDKLKKEWTGSIMIMQG